MEINESVQARLDQLAKLPPAARGGILAVLALLVASVYFGLVYRDASHKLDRLHAQELELQRKLSEVRSIAANIAAFEEEIANLELKLQKVLRQLPNDKEIEVLLTDVSNLGKTAGIEIKSFKRREEVVHDFYAEVPLDIEIEGQYHNIATFFDMLANLPRIVNVGSLDIKVGKDTMDSTILKVTGTATTFRFVGKGEA
jgi:type IV pilus assembly protein PilO